VPEHNNIVLIGAGNVAHHVAPVLQQAGYRMTQVAGRQPERARELAGLLGCEAVTGAGQVSPQAGIYLLAVNDDAIETVVKALPDLSGAVIHTSGTVPLEAVRNRFPNAGVLWIIQTLQKGRPVALRKAPICIEASNPATLDTLQDMARAISNCIIEADSDQRMVLHLAAVLVNNFTNHLFARAEKILAREKLPFDLLQPLIEETARLSAAASPALSQTGPAKRNDRLTLQRHLDYLESHKESTAFYEALSESIRAFYK